SFRTVDGVISPGIARLHGDDGPPIIDTEPQDISTTAGFPAALTVRVANGRPPLGYQWYFNETAPLPGATNLTLALANVQPAQAGAYRLVISNALGMVTSAVAQLSVAVGPG